MIRAGDIGTPRREIEIEPMPATEPMPEPSPTTPDREKVPA